MPIGPALPPHLAHLTASRSPSPPRFTASEQPDGSDDDEDAFGPALPPHLAAARKGPQAGPSKPSLPTFESPSPPRLPGSRPGPSAGPSAVADDDDEDSDDEVIGPVLPTEGVVEKSAVEEFMEREQRMYAQKEESSQPAKPQREEWMLVPPSSGILASVDPLRKRPTTFSRTTKEVDVDHSVWTETPQEKAQRLADEVAGIKRKKPGKEVRGDEEVDRERKRFRDEQIREGIEKHNKEVRGKSLLDQHASRDKKKDEPAAIWDHARDMGVTGRLLNDQERSQKIRDARNLNDRFGHSKRGAYDM